MSCCSGAKLSVNAKEIQTKIVKSLNHNGQFKTESEVVKMLLEIKISPNNNGTGGTAEVHS